MHQSVAFLWLYRFCQSTSAHGTCLSFLPGSCYIVFSERSDLVDDMVNRRLHEGKCLGFSPRLVPGTLLENIARNACQTSIPRSPAACRTVHGRHGQSDGISTPQICHQVNRAIARLVGSRRLLRMDWSMAADDAAVAKAGCFWKNWAQLCNATAVLFFRHVNLSSARKICLAQNVRQLYSDILRVSGDTDCAVAQLSHWFSRDRLLCERALRVARSADGDWAVSVQESRALLGFTVEAGAAPQVQQHASIRGYLIPSAFSFLVRARIAIPAPPAISGLFVRICLTKNMTVADALTFCTLRRDGDVLTADDSSLYFYFPGCGAQKPIDAVQSAIEGSKRLAFRLSYFTNRCSAIAAALSELERHHALRPFPDDTQGIEAMHINPVAREESKSGCHPVMSKVRLRAPPAAVRRPLIKKGAPSLVLLHGTP